LSPANIQRPVLPGWGLDARLTALHSKRIIVAISKVVKTGRKLAELCKEGYGSEMTVLSIVIIIIQVKLFIFMKQKKKNETLSIHY
jgi:hypothetical protein